MVKFITDKSIIISADDVYTLYDDLYNDLVNTRDYVENKDNLLYDLIALYQRISKTPHQQMLKLRAQTSAFFARLTWNVGSAAEVCLLNDRFGSLAQITVAMALYYNCQIKLNKQSNDTAEIAEMLKAKWLLHAMATIITYSKYLHDITQENTLSGLEEYAEYLKVVISKMDTTTKIWTMTILNPWFNSLPNGRKLPSTDTLYQDLLLVTDDTPELTDATLNVVIFRRKEEPKTEEQVFKNMENCFKYYTYNSSTEGSDEVIVDLSKVCKTGLTTHSLPVWSYWDTPLSTECDE
jgi:hypothetical protein